MTAVTMVTLLLLLSLSMAHFSQEQFHVFTSINKRTRFPTSCMKEADYSILYRSTARGKQLLLNISDPLLEDKSFHILVQDQSETGQYVAECWKDGQRAAQKIFHLEVCQTAKHSLQAADFGQSTDLKCEDGNLTARWYRNVVSGEDWTSDLILDSNSSLEIIPDDLKSKMEVSRSGTSIRFWDVAPENLGFYYCAFFTGEYCQRFHEICLIVTKYPVVHFQPGDRVVLPCHSRTAHWRDVKWRGPHSHIDLWSTAHQDPGMHMLNGSRTGNFSLIIPSVSSSHSGRYACVFRSGLLHHEIVVCSRMESLVLMLSPGSSAVLACDPNPDGVSRVQWHHQRGDDAPELILDSNHTSVGLKPSQRGRVDVSNPKTCLIISEPSAEDSGLYRCRVWRSGFCSERKILLQYKDHFSPFYVVYSALVAFSLLVMICAVIYVNMK